MPQPIEWMGEMFGKARGATKDSIKGYGGIFRRLFQEHGEVTALLQRIAATSDDSDVRRELFPKLCKELLAHEHAEEQTLFPILKEHAATQDVADRGSIQHDELDVMVNSLRKTDPSEPGWNQEFKQLVETIKAHFDLEEDEIFPKAKDVLSQQQIDDLGKQFDSVKRRELQPPS